jgi:peptidoglycan/LPS O-acetylase OafA/YrhL
MMRRVAELDGARGVAAIVIVVFHLWWNGGRFGSVMLMGSAVDMFFVLSGFLITDIIMREDRTHGFLQNFYMRRGLRIWPIYYLTILVFLAVDSLRAEPTPTPGLAHLLTYTQSFVEGGPGIGTAPLMRTFSHTWTLSIEELYYLIWPGLVILIGARRVGPACVLLAVASLACRLAGISSRSLAGRCDGFALGGLMAWLMVHRGRIDFPRRRWLAAFLALGLVALSYPAWGRILFRRVLPLSPTSIYAFNVTFFNVFYFSVLGLILLNVGGRGVAWLRDRRLCYLGTVSYGLYLYHPFVFDALAWAGRATGLGRPLWLDFVKLGASLGLAALSWSLVERPILGLKRYFDYRDRPASPSPSPSLPTAAVPRAIAKAAAMAHASPESLT